MARVAMAVMAMMLNPIGGMILIAITIMNIENKQNHLLTLTTWQQFLTVRSKLMVVKKYFMWQAKHNYKSAYMRVKCLTWYLLVVEQKYHEIWRSTKHGYKHKLFIHLKLSSWQDPNQMAEMAVDQELIITLMLWIHSINVFLQYKVLCKTTSGVIYMQQKLSNVVNIKCKIYQQAFNVAPNKNTYRFLAIHKYINPIYMC